MMAGGITNPALVCRQMTKELQDSYQKCICSANPIKTKRKRKGILSNNLFQILQIFCLNFTYAGYRSEYYFPKTYSNQRR